jgi:hydroxylaminobenzene mutase
MWKLDDTPVPNLENQRDAMTDDSAQTRAGRRLLRLGMLLFLLGLVTGLLMPALANPRMGLSSHLEGLMNGMLLMILGLLWHRLRLSRHLAAVAFGLAVYGAYVNWATTLAAAFWGAGGAMMPMAAQGRTGTPVQELLVKFGLVSLTLAILVGCGLVLWGLRGAANPPSDAG